MDKSTSQPTIALRGRRLNRRWLTALATSLLLLLAGCGDSQLSDQTGPADPAGKAEAAVGQGTQVATDSSPLPDPEWATTVFQLQPIATLDAPTAMATRVGSFDLWVGERNGVVRRIERRISSDNSSEQIKLQERPVLDISDRVGTRGEGGLLGMEFALDGKELYLSYTNKSGNSVISAFPMDNNSADPEEERVILTLDQPHSNHNGGHIALGPDGFLYIGFGDGGGSGDPDDNGQKLNTWLGKILRIDPTASADGPYTVPGNNPFTARPDVPDEIWLYGVRNPWRFAFDMATGDMWVADVGQDSVEEVTLLRGGDLPAGRGANLGWRTMEGEFIFDNRGVIDPSLSLADYVGPIHTYGHTRGRCSITGGFVYRGARMPTLRGAYVYTDYCSGELWAIEALGDGRAVWSPMATGETLNAPVSFGQDTDGELYVLEGDGDIVRIQTGRWARSTQVLEEGDYFSSGGLESEIRQGDGSEERYDYVAPTTRSDRVGEDPGADASTTESDSDG